MQSLANLLENMLCNCAELRQAELIQLQQDVITLLKETQAFGLYCQSLWKRYPTLFTEDSLERLEECGADLKTRIKALRAGNRSLEPFQNIGLDSGYQTVEFWLQQARETANNGDESSEGDSVTVIQTSPPSQTGDSISEVD
jgi:hypothetical protein